MLRTIVPVMLSILLPLRQGQAQNYFYDSRYYEPVLLVKGGIGWGTMLALTDLGGHNGKHRPFLCDANKESIHACKNLFAELDFQKGWSLRLQYTEGTVSGADSLAGSTDRYARLRNWRNLHFSSKIRETALLLKWTPIALLPRNRFMRAGQWYLELGIGIFHFLPVAFEGDKSIALAPLHTEGQYLNEEYKDQRYPLTQVNLPIGFGLQIDCNARWQLNLEVQYRVLFTDYLDDVSTSYPGKKYLEKYLHGETLQSSLYWSDKRKQIGETASYRSSTKRGNPTRNDGYGSFTAQLVYVINRRKR